MLKQYQPREQEKKIASALLCCFDTPFQGPEGDSGRVSKRGKEAPLSDRAIQTVSK